MRSSDVSHAGGALPVLRAMQLGAHLLFFLLLAVGVVRTVADSAHPVPIIALAVVVAGGYVFGILFARRKGFENGEPVFCKINDVDVCEPAMLTVTEYDFLKIIKLAKLA